MRTRLFQHAMSLLALAALAVLAVVAMNWEKPSVQALQPKKGAVPKGAYTIDSPMEGVAASPTSLTESPDRRIPFRGDWEQPIRIIDQWAEPVGGARLSFAIGGRGVWWGVTDPSGGATISIPRGASSWRDPSLDGRLECQAPGFRDQVVSYGILDWDGSTRTFALDGVVEFVQPVEPPQGIVLSAKDVSVHPLSSSPGSLIVFSGDASRGVIKFRILDSELPTTLVFRIRGFDDAILHVSKPKDSSERNVYLPPIMLTSSSSARVIRIALAGGAPFSGQEVELVSGDLSFTGETDSSGRIGVPFDSSARLDVYPKIPSLRKKAQAIPLVDDPDSYEIDLALVSIGYSGEFSSDGVIVSIRDAGARAEGQSGLELIPQAEMWFRSHPSLGGDDILVESGHEYTVRAMGLTRYDSTMCSVGSVAIPPLRTGDSAEVQLVLSFEPTASVSLSSFDDLVVSHYSLINMDSHQPVLGRGADTKLQTGTEYRVPPGNYRAKFYPYWGLTRVPESTVLDFTVESGAVYRVDVPLIRSAQMEVSLSCSANMPRGGSSVYRIEVTAADSSRLSPSLVWETLGGDESEGRQVATRFRCGETYRTSCLPPQAYSLRIYEGEQILLTRQVELPPGGTKLIEVRIE